MKIIFFGDSNTYGYDPRAYFGGRYTADSRWVDIVAEQSGWQALNYGQNGRAIPHYEEELSLYRSIFAKEEAELFVVMLGSNDLLMGLSPKAVCVRMERLINSLPFAREKILLICPPRFRDGSWLESEKQIEASCLLSERYAELAGRLGIHYADAHDWDVQISGDGVHFTPRGHRDFARGLYDVLKGIIK